MKKITINCDMGEAFGRYELVDDSELMPLIDECNVACGFHAGDPVVIEKTLRQAIRHGIKIGAHPSFPDRQGFGRRVMAMSPGELEAFLRYQICAVKGLVQCMGGKLNHVKAHGALYNLAMEDEPTAEAIASAVETVDPHLVVFAPASSVQSDVAEKKGLKIRYEGFIDRMYHDDLRLVSRSIDGALITDTRLAVGQANQIIQQGCVTSYEGNKVSIQADTLCIHGDNPSALEILRGLR